MQGIIGVWLITWRTAPLVVLAGGVLLALAPLAATPGWSTRLPPPKAFLLILLTPLFIVVWSGINWAADEHLPGNKVGWRSIVHTVLAFACVVLAFVVPFRFRRSPRWWLLLPCSLAAILYSAAAWFVGAMAIVNDWL